jgi:hypothetical protein
MSKTHFFITLVTTAALLLPALMPIQASAAAPCPPGWTDRFGCTLEYNPSRGDPGPGNGPIWQGEPGDHQSIWRRGYYRGNDPDNGIRGQIMRDR